jgi:hypothetical protein
MKRKAKGGWEEDAFFARHWYHWHPGEAKLIKRKANRRERREVREQIRAGNER